MLSSPSSTRLGAAKMGSNSQALVFEVMCGSVNNVQGEGEHTTQICVGFMLNAIQVHSYLATGGFYACHDILRFF